MIQSILRFVILTITACCLGYSVEGFPVLPMIQQNKLLLLQQPSQPSQQYPFSGHENSSAIFTSRTISRICLSSKQDSNNDSKQRNKRASPPTFWTTLQDKPGGLILLPFVVLFGLDLLLNILFLTKRSLEYFLLGQAPSQETWF
jgi:hypothetical protein